MVKRRPPLENLDKTRQHVYTHPLVRLKAQVNEVHDAQTPQLSAFVIPPPSPSQGQVSEVSELKNTLSSMQAVIGAMDERFSHAQQNIEDKLSKIEQRLDAVLDRPLGIEQRLDAILARLGSGGQSPTV